MKAVRRYSIGRAALRLGVCSKTLLRAEQAERVRFSRQGKGWRFISAADLEVAPVYSIIRAAELMHISTGRMRGMARRVEMKSPPPPSPSRKARWFSMFSLRVLAANHGDELMAVYRPTAWVYMDRGQICRSEGSSLVTTYLPRLDG